MSEFKRAFSDSDLKNISDMQNESFWGDCRPSTARKVCKELQRAYAHIDKLEHKNKVDWVKWNENCLTEAHERIKKLEALKADCIKLAKAAEAYKCLAPLASKILEAAKELEGE